MALTGRFEGVAIGKFCTLLRMRRQSYYSRKKYKPEEVKKMADEILIAQMQAVRKEHISWGFELIYYHLRGQKGLKFCKKRGHGLYKQAQMSLWRNPKKARIHRKFQDLLAPSAPNQGWALDFVAEAVVGVENKAADWYRLLNVVDECSRRCLWVEAQKSMPAQKVVTVLDNLVLIRGKPSYISTDNGAEYISDLVAQWAERNKVEHKFIQAGKPTQNGIIERLNGTLRKECLHLNWFYTKQELDNYLEKWWQIYNFDRPHSSLNFLTPVQFEQQFSSTPEVVA